MAVMDEIGFVYVSLGSSTVQLHDSLCSGSDGHCLGLFLYIHLFFQNQKLYVACASSEPGFSSQNDECG
jgi:hypothetical protein